MAYFDHQTDERGVQNPREKADEKKMDFLER